MSPPGAGRTETVGRQVDEGAARPSRLGLRLSAIRTPRRKPTIPRSWFPLAATVVAVLFLGRWLPASLHAALAVAAVAAAYGAVLVGGRLIEHTRRLRRRDSLRLERILEDADSARSVGEVGEVTEAARRVLELDETLEGVRRMFAAERAILWDLKAPEGVARPRVVVGGEPPRPTRLTGDPLAWTSEERIPLRLSETPEWALQATHVSLVSLDPIGPEVAILSLELRARDEPPALNALERVATDLSAVLRLHQREALAVAAHTRYRDVVEVLREIPRNLEPSAFAAELASSAAALVGATGAAVASWERDSGRVLAVTGDDGGPNVGAAFGPLECELALAASAGTPLLRQDRAIHDPRSLPVATPDERWFAKPRALAIFPLHEPGEGVLGLLALWSADVPNFEPESLAAVQALAPYAAILLLHVRQYRRMHERAEFDSLTGLHNRRAFEDRLADASVQFARYKRPLALVLFDIDHFKKINDSAGHVAGDEVLRAIGAIVRQSSREADFAARFGGEEFVILLPETGLAEAAEAAERLRRNIQDADIVVQGQTLPLHASFGVCAAPDCVPDVGSLLSTADDMLYESKAAGRNRVTLAPLAGQLPD